MAEPENKAQGALGIRHARLLVEKLPNPGAVKTQFPGEQCPVAAFAQPWLHRRDKRIPQWRIGSRAQRGAAPDARTT